MFCEQCGCKVARSSAFCDNCGAPVPPEYKDEPMVHERTVVEQKVVPQAEVVVPKTTENQLPKQNSVKVRTARVLPSGKLECPLCGAANPPDLEVCFKCGQVMRKGKKSVPATKPQASEPAPKPKIEKRYHPYQDFGGFLAFFVIVGMIVCAYIVYKSAANFHEVYELLDRSGKWIGSGQKSLLRIALFAYAIDIISQIHMIRIYFKIINRDPDFLWFYHKLYIVIVALYGFVVLLYKMTDGVYINTDTFIKQMFIYVVKVVVITLYFVKSVRVRTYMGSEEYLRYSPFTMNLESPIDASVIR